MKNRWSQSGVDDALSRWGDDYGELLALRLYTARLIGAEPDLVLHGGGNVSVKLRRPVITGADVEAVCIKASGVDLASATPSDLPAVEIERLQKLRTLDSLGDDAMVNEVRRGLLDTQAPTPSIEALLHVFLTHTYVDHSHADVILALTNQPDGGAWIRRALGERVAIVPYVDPGFELAKAVADAVDANPRAEGVVLLHHGLVTFGDDARTSYERHISIVDACERFLADETKGKSTTVAFRCDDDPRDLAVRIAPMMRGLLAHRTGYEDRPYAPPILEWRGHESIMTAVDSAEIVRIAETGPLASDHVIRTKSRFLLVENPKWDDDAALQSQLADSVDSYRSAYSAYVEKNGGATEELDSAPRVVMVPGAGLFSWGQSKRDAVIAADIAEHTIHTKMRANFLDSFTSLSDENLFAMEYREIQRAKLTDQSTKPLSGRVVVISGGAGAIGVGIARSCVAAGAQVALTDLDETRVRAVAEMIDAEFGIGSAIPIVMDVTDEASVSEGYDNIVRAFGGLDVVVPNAGIAHVASIENLQPADFDRVMAVNAGGCLRFMQRGVRILKSQKLGGHVIVISSKNVFGPGKEFGAYSASKAAAHQLGRVAALELAEFGIRVNMIAPDAVFGDENVPSGLWQQVGPSRAKSRNMKVGDLPEYYRKRNLLGARVHAHHVGNAIVFFASNSTPTTGATLPVDGGVTDAFPR